MTDSRSWMTTVHERKGLDAMNNLGLWLTWTTPGHKLKALDATNNLGLGMTWTIMAQ